MVFYNSMRSTLSKLIKIKILSREIRRIQALQLNGRKPFSGNTSIQKKTLAEEIDEKFSKKPRNWASLTCICLNSPYYPIMHNLMDGFRFSSDIRTSIDPITRRASSYDTPKVTWYANDAKLGGPVKQAGGRVGKLDAAFESGFFHRINQARLKNAKRRLEQMKLEKKPEAPPKVDKKEK